MTCQDLGKSYTVYRVEVTTLDGRYFSSEKRYSGFHDLYIKCREQYILNTNFPPKKLSNTTAKVCNVTKPAEVLRILLD